MLVPQHLHFVLQLAVGQRALASGQPVGQVKARGGVGRGGLQAGPGVGAHEPGGGVAVQEGLAHFVEVGLGDIEKRAGIGVGQLQVAQV